MTATRGMDYLRPFLPGLESILEDEDVSEIMINGPGNVWIERAGVIRTHPAPDLDDAALYRAALQIARPLGLDPSPIPFSTPAWTTAPVSQFVSRRPPRRLPSLSGALASAPIPPRTCCAPDRSLKKCLTRPRRRCSIGKTFLFPGAPDPGRRRC